MAVTVRIPTPLQRLTNGQGEVQCAGTTVQELLADLEQRHPGIQQRICDEQGKLRRFVNVFVNEEDIRFLQGDQTAVKDGDEVSIIPAIAGGQAAKAGVLAVLAVALLTRSAAAAVDAAKPAAAGAPAAPPACDERKVIVGEPVAAHDTLAAYYAPTGELAVTDTASRRTLWCQGIGVLWDVNGFQSIPKGAVTADNALVFVVSGEGQPRYFDARTGRELYLVSDEQQHGSFLSDAPPPVPGTPLKVFQQWKGRASGAPAPSFHQAVSRAVWEDLWTGFAKQPAPAPEVDFASNMALAIFASPASQAGGVAVTDVREHDDKVVVRYALQGSPAPGQPDAAPFGLILLPRVAKKPVIVQEGVPRGPGGPIRWVVQYKFEPLPAVEPPPLSAQPVLPKPLPPAAAPAEPPQERRIQRRY